MSNANQFIDSAQISGLIDPTVGSYANPGAIPGLADFIPGGVAQEAIPLGGDLTNLVPGGGFVSDLATGDIAGGPFTGGDTTSGPSAFDIGKRKINKTFNIGAGAGAGLDMKTIAIIGASIVAIGLVGFLIFKTVKK